MRRALGKGLSQLLSEQTEASPTTLPVGKIVPNTRQPRTVFDLDALEDLAASIREYGILQPIIVRHLGDGEYELIAGERRLRASKLAGLQEVPVVVRPASAQASLEIALVENVQRADISPMECAFAYRRLADEFGMGQEQIADRVGKSRVTIANTLRLLKLPLEIQDALQEGSLSEGHARALLMSDSPARQLQLFQRIQSEGLSVREVERAARGETAPRVSSARKGKSKAPASQDPNLEALAQGLSEFLGSPARIEPGEVGGQLVVDYYSDDDLQRILDVLGFRY
jgi:ParB family chromosome partitioning protein